MAFLHFLKSHILASAMAGTSIGALAALAILLLGNVGGEINVDLELSRSDTPWILVLTPLLSALLGLLSSPITFLLKRGLQRDRVPS